MIINKNIKYISFKDYEIDIFRHSILFKLRLNNLFYDIILVYIKYIIIEIRFFNIEANNEAIF